MDGRKHTKNTCFSPKLCSGILVESDFIPLLASICGLLLLSTFAMFRGLSNQSEKGGKDQESVQSSTTPDPGYHIGK